MSLLSRPAARPTRAVRPVLSALLALLAGSAAPSARAADPGGDKPIPQGDYQFRFCLAFAQIEGNFVGATLREMEATPYPVDEYFTTSTCQPDGYSDVVKSPIIHTVADDPSKRVGFLDSIWLYYSKKRKEPGKFAAVVNAKNTEGETLLDYIESMRSRGKYTVDGTKASLEKIVSSACAHGAVYSVYKDKRCP